MVESFDDLLERRSPESRKKAYYLMSIHEYSAVSAGAPEGRRVRSLILQLGCTKGALTLKCLSVVAAVTATLPVAVMEGAMISVAVMLWLPAVMKVTPLVKAWEPASAVVNA